MRHLQEYQLNTWTILKSHLEPSVFSFSSLTPKPQAAETKSRAARRSPAGPSEEVDQCCIYAASEEGLDQTYVNGKSLRQLFKAQGGSVIRVTLDIWEEIPWKKDHGEFVCLLALEEVHDFSKISSGFGGRVERIF